MTARQRQNLIKNVFDPDTANERYKEIQDIFKRGAPADVSYSRWHKKYPSASKKRGKFYALRRMWAGTLPVAKSCSVLKPVSRVAKILVIFVIPQIMSDLRALGPGYALVNNIANPTPWDISPEALDAIVSVFRIYSNARRFLEGWCGAIDDQVEGERTARRELEEEIGEPVVDVPKDTGVDPITQLIRSIFGR